MIKKYASHHRSRLKTPTLGLTYCFAIAPLFANALPVEPTLHITGSMDFGSTFYGEQVDRTIELNNAGPGEITVQDLGFTDHVQITPTLPFSISEGDNQAVTISFTADENPVLDTFPTSSFINMANGIKTEPQAQMPSMAYYHQVIENADNLGWYYQGGLHTNDGNLLKTLFSNTTLSASPDGRFIYLHGANTHKADSLWVLEVSEHATDTQPLRIVQTLNNLLSEINYISISAPDVDYNNKYSSEMTVSPDGQYIAISSAQSVVILQRQSNDKLTRIYPLDENMIHNFYGPDISDDNSGYRSISFHSDSSMLQLESNNGLRDYLALEGSVVSRLSENDIDSDDTILSGFDKTPETPNYQYSITSRPNASDTACEVSLFNHQAAPSTPPTTWRNDCKPWKKTTLRENRSQRPLSIVENENNLYIIEYDHLSHFKTDSAGEVTLQSRERYRDLRDTSSLVHVKHGDGQQSLVALRDSGVSKINILNQGELDLDNANHQLQIDPNRLLIGKDQYLDLNHANHLYLSPDERLLIVRGFNSLSIYKVLEKGQDGIMLELNEWQSATQEKSWLKGSGGSIVFDNDAFFFMGPVRELVKFHNDDRTEENGLSWVATPVRQSGVITDNWKAHINGSISDMFLSSDKRSFLLIDTARYENPTVIRLNRETGEYSASTLSMPVKSSKYLYAMSADRQQIAVANDNTLTVFRLNEKGHWDFLNHFENRFLGGLSNIGAIAFSPNGKFLYTVTKPFDFLEGSAQDRSRKQAIMVFGIDNEGQWQWERGLEGSNNISGGTDMQFSADGTKMFISSKPSPAPERTYRTNAFKPDVYYTNPETGALALISNIEQSTETEFRSHEDTRIAIANNGNRVYTLSHNNLAIYDKVLLETPTFISYTDRGEQQPRLSTEVSLQSKGLSFSGLDLSDLMVTGGSASNFSIQQDNLGELTTATVTIKPEGNGGTVTISLPENSYHNRQGAPNLELKPIELEFLPSLIPYVETESTVQYGEITKVRIEFGQAVENFNASNFPWSLFEAELLDVEMLESGYELSITPTSNHDGNISFVLEDGVLSAKNNSSIKNFAIPETKIEIQAVK